MARTLTTLEDLLPTLAGATSANEVGRRMCAAGLTGRANAPLFLAALAHLGLSAPKPATVDRCLCARNYAPDYVAAQDEASKAWRVGKAHKERAYRARYKAANPEKVKAANAAWRDANRPATVEASMRWRAENPEAYREQQRQYQARRRGEDDVFRFTNSVRSLVGGSIKRGGGAKSASSERLLGCTMEEFRAHVARQFLDGMAWANYGDWHLDHVRPCASFDLTTEEGRLACMNFTNWRPLWSEDNLRKGSLWRGRRWRHGEAG